MAYGEALEQKYKKLAGSSSLIDKCTGVFGLIRQKNQLRLQCKQVRLFSLYRESLQAIRDLRHDES